MRFGKRILIGLLVIAVFFAAAFAVLLFSPLGVHLAQLGIEAGSGGKVQIGSASGLLCDKFSFTDICYTDGEKEKGRVGYLALQWKPLELFHGRLHLQKVDVDRVYIRAEKREKQEQHALHFPLLPLDLVVEESVITDFFYDRGKDKCGKAKTSFLFDSIRLAAFTKVTKKQKGVHLQKFVAVGPDMAANFTGRFFWEDVKNSLAKKTNKSAQIELDGTFRFAGFGFHSMTGQLSIAGEAQQPKVSLALNSPGILAVDGQLHNLFIGSVQNSTNSTGGIEKPFWEAKLTGRDFDLSLWIKHCPQIVVEKAKAAMHGDFSHYEGHALFVGHWGHFDQLRLEGDLWGNGEYIDFPKLALHRNEAVVKADDGWISWKNIFDWKGDIVIANINPALFTGERLDGGFDGKFYAKGEVLKEDFESVFENIDLRGNLHNQPLVAQGSLTIHKRGLQTDQLQIESGDDAGHVILGPASFNWKEKRQWFAVLSLQEFDPSSIFPEYKGKIDGEIESSGNLADGKQPLSASLQIKNLDGTLRGKKLHGEGNATFTNNLFASDGLLLQFGKTELHLTEGQFATGDGAKKVAMKMEFRSPDLQEILPEAKGSLHCKASATGTRQHPDGTISFAGEHLGWRQFSAQKTKGSLRLQWHPQGKSNGEVEITDLQSGEIRLQQIMAKLTGTMDNHRLVLFSKGHAAQPFSAKIAAAGGVSLSPWLWKGQLVEGDIELPHSEWHQQQNASLQIAAESCSLENFAFRSPFATLSTSASAVKNKDSWQWQTEATLDEMELKQWQKKLHWPADVSGAFSARLSAKGENLLPTQGSFTAELPETLFKFENLFAQGESVKLTNGKIIGTLIDGTLDMTGGFAESGGGKLDYWAQIQNVGSSRLEQPLSGEIFCDGIDVGILGNFLSYGQPFGHLHTELSLAGVARQPKLSGTISLDGGVGVLSQGITLKKPEITLDAGREGVKLWGKASSGDGFIKLDGQLLYNDDGIEGSLFAGGRNFLAVDLPEYSFTVNPDLQFQFNRHKGKLTGDVAVVSGIIEPNYLPDTVSTSDDVVLVQKGEKAVANPWQFSMDVGVALGEKVRINGYGLNGTLGGKMKVKMAPEELLSATGTLKLHNGKFALYGRSLDITRGNIIFSGGPIDNPGIDARAEKSMSKEQSLEEGYTVGVEISGLAQNLQYHLFSTPPMSETDILSYMILGHSLAGSNAGDESILTAAAETLGLQGSTLLLGDLGKLLSFDDVHLEGSVENEDVSLVVGKHLTRDIYIGYDVNMYNQLGEFWVRYELGKGFSVQTFSSSQSTGADLQFSFEK